MWARSFLFRGFLINCRYLTPEEVESCALLAKAAFSARPGSREAMQWEDTMDQVHKGWSAAANQKDLHRLLTFLFEWKAGGRRAGANKSKRKGEQDNRRDCIIAAGGIGAAAETEIHDTKTGLTIRQICVGSIAEHPKQFLPGSTGAREFGIARHITIYPLLWAELIWTIVDNVRTGQLGSGYGKRFQFLHRPLTAGGLRKSYATVTMSTTDDTDVWPRWQGVRIDVGFVRANERVPAPRGTLGPIIGEVTSSSAVVLLEINRDSAVRCKLRDTLSGEEFEQVRLALSLNLVLGGGEET